ncbi:MAG: SDR family oxidoreductase [Rhodococcus sp.]|nr:SDR family oxidoreductase [Rhodococcus sp. (in: high G+C Gram-positive bacteria)]
MPAPIAANSPRVALVTGGTGGIGSAIARQLAHLGYDVAITYRTNADVAADLVGDLRLLGVGAASFSTDLVDEGRVRNVVRQTIERFGALTTLVHAAGPHVPMKHLSRISPADYAQHVEQEAVAFFTVVQASLSALRESSGSVVAVTTAATERYPVRDGLSPGTKGAIDQLVRGFAAEEGRFGVRFNAVGPGMLTDGMAQRLISSADLDQRALDAAMSNIPLGRFGTAADVAEAVCFLAGDGAAFITGQKLNVDGGYTV